jgi:hypothetical protein
MIPVMIYLCKNCKEKENKEVLLLDYEIAEPAYKMKGMFCQKCLTFYVTEGELDIRKVQGTNLDRVRWPSNSMNN